MNARQEIERLYFLDYGNPVEFGIRFGAIFFAAVSFYVYSGWLITWVWFGAYAATHLLYFIFLRLRKSSATRLDLHVASVLLLVVIAAFLWFPAYLVLQPDRTMQIGGIGAIGITVVIMVRRSDTPLLVIITEIIFLALIAAAILFSFLPSLEFVSAKLTLTVIGVAFVAYFGEAIVTTRNQRLRAEAKRTDDLQAQKMETLGRMAGGIAHDFNNLLTAIGGNLTVIGVAFVAYFGEAIVTTRNQRLRAEAKRTDDLQAQKMETLGRMAGGIAHDFNNLLTAIGGNLDLYSEVTDQARRDEFVDAAKTATISAAAHVEQLLVYARRAHRVPVLTNTRTVLTEAHNLAYTLLPSLVRLTVDFPDEPALIKVDTNQMVNSVLNLITNARDAMPGGGHIDLSYRITRSNVALPQISGESLPPGDFVEIHVSDTGPGIDEEILPQVVEPFFTTKGRVNGTGLGLSMVEGFCRSSNGGLSIRTSSGGTVVCIFLPLVTADQANEG